MNKKHKILLILTGGTICSFADERGERGADVERAQTLIVKNFREGVTEAERNVEFEVKHPLNILSENMTTVHWNILIEDMKTYDFSGYDGIIMLHGTDTLAYTASLLSLLLAGISIPVFLVSSQLPIYMPEANGNANFKAAVGLILNGIRPNVYVVYRNCAEKENQEETMYLHYGAHLLQCANHSNDFYSVDMQEISTVTGYCKEQPADSKEMLLYQCKELKPCVLRIEPYVGVDYSRYSLKGVKAVLHGTYHSSTMAVNPYEDKAGIKGATKGHSILSLLERCQNRKEPIPLFIEPCNEEAYDYETTGMVLRSGASAIWRMTPEMSYVKLLIGCAMGYKRESLLEFTNREINGEFVR